MPDPSGKPGWAAGDWTGEVDGSSGKLLLRVRLAGGRMAWVGLTSVRRRQAAAAASSASSASILVRSASSSASSTPEASEESADSALDGLANELLDDIDVGG